MGGPRQNGWSEMRERAGGKLGRVAPSGALVVGLVCFLFALAFGPVQDSRVVVGILQWPLFDLYAQTPSRLLATVWLYAVAGIAGFAVDVWLRKRCPHLLVDYRWVLGAFLVYSLLAAPRLPAFVGARLYVALSDAMLHGRLSLPASWPDPLDLTLHNGRYYVPFPPLPAAALLPFVWIFGTGVNEVFLNVILAAVNVMLFRRLLRLLPTGTVEERHWPWLTLLFAFGTPHVYSAVSGEVWYMAHIFVTGLLLLAFGEALKSKVGWRSGVFLGMAVMCRLTAIFTAVFFLIWSWFQSKGEDSIKSRVRPWIQFGLPIVGALALLWIYNYVRFGNGSDFGYTRALLAPAIREHMVDGRAFSIHYVVRNVYYSLVSVPLLVDQFPYLKPNPWGMGLFWVSPALLLAFASIRKQVFPVACWVAVLLTHTFLMFCFPTGWVQFGYRYVLDYLPFLIVLAGVGGGVWLGKPLRWLTVTSVVLHVYGTVYQIYLVLL